MSSVTKLRDGGELTQFSEVRTDEQRRQLARERVDACRERRRHGQVLVPVAVGPLQLAALERLGLLDVDERDKPAIARAVTRYLDSAAPVAAVGDAIWPADEDGLAA